MSEQKSSLNVVMGAMTFGYEGTDGGRLHTPEAVSEVLDVFQKHGHKEIDSARVYTSGSSEELLGKIDYKARGLLYETKLYPHPQIKISHSPADLREHLDKSLKAMNIDCLEMWYLHGPDRTTPYEETLRTVNELYKEGKFKRFGISNYYSWEVAEIVTICRSNQWIQPTVYQGLYNGIQRRVEPELFPCLRKFGLSFYAFNALGGGFFTGKYTPDSDASGQRFDTKNHQGQAYRKRYWNDPYFKALDLLRPVCEKHGLTLAEVALRWMSHHSLLKRELGDAVIIGASSTKHLEQNLIDLEKGPLPEDVQQALDEAWTSVMPIAANYWH
ncbi:Aldo/keto reductase [Peniophora sp. CONT]|nr:Aldo/keto reductase [Peniophora sp. CONT]